ncbi:uncharacterized protein cusr [Silurus meridionalis]|uniref:Superoxide dismutase copper/zinc binding domain-containing protein n=1 Tax=Silurus meridionalis TaxID=175797 RepID=A0A8T0A913_SILME|nr:uncharacterized protein cusr [Silurus meridionalis]KAF7688296.1 hypothetical protein HF521_014302 [Silurus meridionalis]
MCLSAALLLLTLCGPAVSQFLSIFNMAGITGSVRFDSIQQTATVNLSGPGTGTCDTFNLTLTEFPVMYGHVAQPCQKAQIGARVFTFSINTSITVVNVSRVFQQTPNLEARSLLVETCNGKKACSGVIAESQVTTYHARFFSVVAGNIYLRQTSGQPQATLLSDLVNLNQNNFSSFANVSVFLSQSSAASCEELLGRLNPNSLINLGQLMVGTPLNLVKSRLEIPSLNLGFNFALLKLGSEYTCANIRTLEPKEVHALIDMRGVKGYIFFRQESPFEPTTLSVTLANLNRRVGPYHIHMFPTPQMRSPPESTCSNDNVGGHLNPFDVDTQPPVYPPPAGSTHDYYEIGDLSSRHGSLSNADNIQANFTDWNLPLFGQNSIVGRSVVLHQPNGTRFICSSIDYPGNVITARAIFQGPVIGTILFTQLIGNPFSDISVFLDLSYGRPDSPATQKHHWHIHNFPISTESDSDNDCCWSTGGHWNPYNINTSLSSYKINCRPECPFACEIGDLSGKHKIMNLSANVSKLPSKNFFTDTTAWMSGLSSMIGRSVVIHGPDEAGHRIACANITLLRFPSAQTRSWQGSGSSVGNVHFLQHSPQGPTNIHVSLSSLEAKAGGYHVHLLPVKSGPDACSNENVMGHFNPYNVNISTSPSAANGTVDQYEIGDISGKFGSLNDQTKFENHYKDCNMPLGGPNSIVGRSLVIHYRNGSRMQCADIAAMNSSDGYWVTAKAIFNSTVKGTVIMSQQCFPDGSFGDVTLLVDLKASVNVTNASWYISKSPVNGTVVGCPGNGDIYNPFNMTTQSSNCSPFTCLACVVGDLTSKHGPVSLNLRQLFTDAHLHLAGDYTVIYRSLVLRAGNEIIDCAAIVPGSPSAQQIFPSVPSFSRYDFRARVADVLEVQVSRVSILPGAFSTVAEGKCQQVTFMVSGDISLKKLSAVKDSEKMGMYRQTEWCTKSGVPGLLSSHIFLAAVYLLHSLVVRWTSQ